MASYEDINPESTSIERGAPKHDTSHIVNGMYVPPVNQWPRTNKNVLKSEHVKCNATSKPHSKAVIRVETHANGPVNMCQYHWDKIKNNVSAYKPGPMWIRRDKDLAKDINVETAINNLESRSRDSEAIFNVTGQHVPVRGPGNPTPPRSEEDQVTPVIDRAATAGGHTGPDHENKLYVAHQALLNAMEVGKGNPDPEVYHIHAHSGGITDKGERDKYFIHAMNYHKKLMGKKNLVPKPDMTEALGADYNQEQYDPFSSFDEAKNLLESSSIPSAVQAGQSGKNKIQD